MHMGGGRTPLERQYRPGRCQPATCGSNPSRDAPKRHLTPRDNRTVSAKRGNTNGQTGLAHEIPLRNAKRVITGVTDEDS